jgi:hypothetical protein
MVGWETLLQLLPVLPAIIFLLLPPERIEVSQKITAVKS